LNIKDEIKNSNDLNGYSKIQGLKSLYKDLQSKFHHLKFWDYEMHGKYVLHRKIIRL